MSALPRMVTLVAAAAIGAALIAGFSDIALRASMSYVDGIVLSAVVLEIGLFNVRYVDRYLPQLTVVVAVGSYAMTGILLALVLAASSPRVVVAPAVAAGLIVAVIIELGFLIKSSWVRAEHPDAPVTLLLHDDRPTRT